MDFAKFVSLLDTGALHFSRVDQFTDPFEGSLSKTEFEYWRDIAAKGEADATLPPAWKGKYFDILLDNARRARRSMYVNCWHLDDDESEAMWGLYAPSGFGIAVQSTYARLVNVLPTKLHNGCFVGLVRYTDHDRDSMPSGNVFYPVLHKRRAFEHEKEVRALIWLGDKGRDADPDQTNNPLSLRVPVSLTDLAESVCLSPLVPAWFVGAVKGVIKRYGASFPVHQSDLIRRGYF